MQTVMWTQVAVGELGSAPAIGAAGGGLDRYVRAVNRFALLSWRDEKALARRLRDTGDPEAARALALPHLRLVVAVARRYLGYGLPHADLIQEGSIGLLKAVKHFDPERGTRLAAYATHWIQAAIQEYVVRNWRLIKVATTKAKRKLFFNLRSMKSGLAPLDRAEARRIAETLNVNEKEVVEMEMRMAGRDISFETKAQDGYAPVDYLAAGDQPLAVIEREENNRVRRSSLQNALLELDPRSHRIIEARWLCEDRPATLRELALELGLSIERIRQIETSAIAKMRTRMRIDVV
jgi:RNA polymerase sigma-32 factor